MTDFNCLTCKDMRVISSKETGRLAPCPVCSPSRQVETDSQIPRKANISKRRMSKRMRERADFIRYNLGDVNQDKDTVRPEEEENAE